MLEIGDVPFTIPDDKPSRREALAYYRCVVRPLGHRRAPVRVRHRDRAVPKATSRCARGDGTDPRASTGRRQSWSPPGASTSPTSSAYPARSWTRSSITTRSPTRSTIRTSLWSARATRRSESALEMYRNGARVSMVHFLDTIDKGVKPWVVPDITNRLKNGEITIHWRHRVAEIRHGSVVLKSEDTGRVTEIANDFVVAMTGWRADHPHPADPGRLHRRRNRNPLPRPGHHGRPTCPASTSPGSSPQGTTPTRSSSRTVGSTAGASSPTGWIVPIRDRDPDWYLRRTWRSAA